MERRTERAPDIHATLRAVQSAIPRIQELGVPVPRRSVRFYARRNSHARHWRHQPKTQHIRPESITIDKTFEELKIDSLDGMNILFAVEEEFDVNVPDDQVPAIRSVRDMVEGIEKLLASKPPPEKVQ